MSTLINPWFRILTICILMSNSNHALTNYTTNRENTMEHTIFIWDNDGTIMGSLNPHDTGHAAKIILPNVEKLMRQETSFNIICSGCKTPESELQNFDPVKIIAKFKELMAKLPIHIATFSPAIGGTECWVIIKKSDTDFEIREAHTDTRYTNLIGQFKKPESGMLLVIKDILQEVLETSIEPKSMTFIGDTEHDKIAAQTLGIPFVWAYRIHQHPEAETIVLTSLHEKDSTK